jgi:glycosyltransferase involved in cell wall biosynthesis
MRLDELGCSTDILPSANFLSSQKYDAIINVNGRQDSLVSKFWCLKNRAKLLIPGQSGPGLDDRFNLYVFPDVFISLTQAQCDWAKQINPLVAHRVIPNGVDLKKFFPSAGKKNFDIICVAALEKSKRIDLLIYAAAKAKLSLLLVGTGSLKSPIDLLGKKMLGDKFLLTCVEHDLMPALYQSARLLAFPTSSHEAFGIVLVEAMACNLPIVTTSDPIRTEIVGQAGLYVDPTNLIQFSQALETAKGKNWSDIPLHQAQKFSWDNIARVYVSLLTEICCR